MNFFTEFVFFFFLLLRTLMVWELILPTVKPQQMTQLIILSKNLCFKSRYVISGRDPQGKLSSKSWFKLMTKTLPQHRSKGSNLKKFRVWMLPGEHNNSSFTERPSLNYSVICDEMFASGTVWDPTISFSMTKPCSESAILLQLLTRPCYCKRYSSADGIAIDFCKIFETVLLNLSDLSSFSFFLAHSLLQHRACWYGRNKWLTVFRATQHDVPLGKVHFWNS